MKIPGKADSARLYVDEEKTSNIDMSQDNKESLPLLAVLLLFFFSGALALVYQVVWSRMMLHVFGSTAFALGTVLAAFMAGLAIGAWLIGKAADRSSNCLRLYAFLEIGLALTALLSHILLSRISPIHLLLHDIFVFSDSAFALVRFLLAFILVMAPTILMGATLPVLTRFLVKRQTLVGINLSTLYALNTFGAVTGVLLTGFHLIGTYGVHIPVYIAVSGNLLVGGIAWLVSLRITDSPPSALPSAPDPVNDPAGKYGFVGPFTFRVIVAGLGISGFTSFAYEIYWTRSLVFILGNSTYAMTTMLAAFLSGIAIGGFLIRYLLRRIGDRVALFGWIQVFIGLFSALALPFVIFNWRSPVSE